MNQTKICKVCEKTFPATPEYFHKEKRGIYELRAMCKNCTREYRKEKLNLQKKEINLKDLKGFTLLEGMSNKEVNMFTNKWVDFLDDKYLGSKHKHKWKCKCGIIITREWDTIRRSERLTKCSECSKEYSYKEKVNLFFMNLDEYKLIELSKENGVFYIEYIHTVCNSIYKIKYSSNLKNIIDCRKCKKYNSKVSKVLKYYSKICESCGCEFTSLSNSSKYCSDNCKINIHTLNCLNCKKEFVSNRKTQKFCSSDCRFSHVYMIKCLQCNSEFKSRTLKTKFCCNECKKTYTKLNQDTRCKNPKALTKKEKKGLDKISKSNYKDIVSFHVNEIISRGIIARDNFGISKIYHTHGFTSVKKSKVLERDNHACRICGKTYGLEVHHIEKVKHGGSSEMDNLISLCRSCHRAIDTFNIEHAVKICTINAENHLGVDYNIKNTSNDKMQDISSSLNFIYNRMVNIPSDDSDIEEILISLNTIIELCEK